ncbi:hypothetical protein EDEG_00803 [Edhazardia aedis USNM 41457]|uniref:Uncharacterized protein n=1 Tax=Edhazardia aedis (strain USNM 41457) TaxID=1003232 RepID=J9DRB1_EDHAE|nr:hypothetical protein EDEG_00803 [Edhazardia aedis USNM 41457]|eukprot:EJW05090.1 hypothetical protein EDEG_00803 [Edhazardia aedis USNM 41457]
MLAKYKIRKLKKEQEKITVKAKKVPSLHSTSEKLEIEKIKLMVNSKNKQNAYKRISKLDQETFDFYIHYLSSIILIQMLDCHTPVVFKCFKRVMKSTKLECIANYIKPYLLVLKNDIEVVNILRQYKKSLGEVYGDLFGDYSGIVKLYKYNDVKPFTR